MHEGLPRQGADHAEDAGKEAFEELEGPGADWEIKRELDKIGTGTEDGLAYEVESLKGENVDIDAAVELLDRYIDGHPGAEAMSLDELEIEAESEEGEVDAAVLLEALEGFKKGYPSEFMDFRTLDFVREFLLKKFAENEELVRGPVEG